MAGNGWPRTYGGCLPVSLLRISPRGPTVSLPSLARVAAWKSGGQEALRFLPGGLIERLAGLRPLGAARGGDRERGDQDEGGHDEAQLRHHQFCSPANGRRTVARIRGARETELAEHPGRRPLRR